MAIGRIPEPGTGIPESIVDAKGDLVTATAADTPARLAVGTNEHRLVAASGETTGLKYVADTTNYAIAAKGDLLVGTAADTLQALSVGTNGHTLVADDSVSLGVKWAAPASSSGPAFQATLTNAQTLNQNTTTTVTFNAENFDTDSCFNTTNYRFTPNKAGYYWIYGQLFLAQGNVARMIVTIDKNGSEYCRLFDLNTSPNVEWYFNGGITMYLNGTTDYVTMSAWLGGTATRQVVNTDTNNRTRFEGYFIRS